MSSYDRDWVNIWIKNSDTYVLRNKNVKKIFVPIFYHDRANRNFLKHFVFVKRHDAKADYLTENTTFGRVLYEYVKQKPLSQLNYVLNADDNEFPFPQKWHRNKGYTIDGISFAFKDAPNEINNILKASDGLINDFTNNNIEETNNSLTVNIFFDEKTFKEKVKEFNAIPKKEFINESFFLYDKSNTIKKTFITALDKEISIYESFSYFSGKKAAKNLKLLDISNHLKFLVEKKAIKKKS